LRNIASIHATSSMKSLRLASALAALLSLPVSLHAAEPAQQRVPAFTAYLDPDPRGARVSERAGLSRWNDPATTISWFGELKHTGTVSCAVSLKLPETTSSKLRLTVAGQSRDTEISGKGSEEVSVSFGDFQVPASGYQRFTLSSLNATGVPAGDVVGLVLGGPAVVDAHFNLKPRRNAASVHLMYPVATGTKVEAFYCEATAVEEPLWTFYMVCGWHRGYFGMQINSPTERRIIFSVWDSGSEGVDRKKVAAEDRVTLMAKGDGVYSGDFGNEGTGGHSHLKYFWKTGEKQRFLVTAKAVDASHTVYSGYYFHPDSHRWMLISSWRAPKDGGLLRGLHSFSENFGGDNGHLRRKALYGNQWIRLTDGDWTELTTAKFSHDATGKADRLDRFMGVENGQFFLSHGGFVPGSSAYGETFNRPALGVAPADAPAPVGK
jgi:hypothetical protein